MNINNLRGRRHMTRLITHNRQRHIILHRSKLLPLILIVSSDRTIITITNNMIQLNTYRGTITTMRMRRRVLGTTPNRNRNDRHNRNHDNPFFRRSIPFCGDVVTWGPDTSTTDAGTFRPDATGALPGTEPTDASLV